MANISIEKLDTKIFSRFGSVIEKKNASELRSINQGTTTRYHNISELSLESKNGNSVFLSSQAFQEVFL
jgi:ureidoglycolate lyase